MGQNKIQDYKQEFMDDIRSADMVLVGLGEEFDDLRNIRDAEGYVQGRELLADSDHSFLIPTWQRMFREAVPEETQKLKHGLQKLIDCLAEKNYFVVAVTTNPEIAQLPWREGSLVMPCGSDLRCQCDASCEKHLRLMARREQEAVREQLQKWKQAAFQNSSEFLSHALGTCSACGNRLELNNIYNGSYDENGYLSDWKRYTKWLQGSLNKKIVVLELGVGMTFPSVIRFPFEKIAYFNQKAIFYRVNDNLYQMTEELAEKGYGIAKNAIDWLQNLC